MSRYLFSVAVTCMVLSCAAVANAQTVQLPTFEFFGAATTVVVPNQGEIAVVGHGGRMGMRDRAALASSGRGGARAIRGIGISAVVHDLAELDRQVLAQAARMRPLVTAPSRSSASSARPKTSDPSSAARPEMSLREIRRLQEPTRARLSARG
jgi:hypothetical protein